MMLLTEAPVPSTYSEMGMWILATVVFLMMGLIGYYKIPSRRIKLVVVAICVVLTAFCGICSYTAYIEASGKMIM